MAAPNEKMLDAGFELRTYCRQWSKSELDHWATIAAIQFSTTLHPQERLYRILVAQIISVLIQFWIGTLPAQTNQASQTAASNLCLQMHGTRPVSTRLDAVMHVYRWFHHSIQSVPASVEQGLDADGWKRIR